MLIVLIVRRWYNRWTVVLFEIGSDGGSSAKVQVGDLGRMREATKLFWYEQNEQTLARLGTGLGLRRDV